MPISGKLGAINGLGTIRNWSIDESANMFPIIASNTSCGENNVPTVRTWSGSWQEFGVVPSIMPGESGQFIGFAGPANGVSGQIGPAYSGNIFVSSAIVTHDFSTGEPVGIDINFEGDGPLTIVENNPNITDVTTPDITNTCGLLGLDIDDGTSAGGGGFETQLNVSTIEMTFEAALQSFSDSSTRFIDIASGRFYCWNKQVVGPLRFQVALTYNQAFNNKYPIGDVRQLKIFTDDVSNSLFWLFKWAIAGDKSNFNVNIDTGEIVQYTQTWNMYAFHDLTVPPINQLGTVLKPGGVAWWPTPVV